METKRKLLLRELIGGLWHTTSHDRYNDILNTGAIIPEPNIPDSKRWCTGSGRKHYPYVRHIGGISLFEFDQFDPDSYSEKYIASWDHFVPYREKWKHSVWIEIDREQVTPPALISAPALLNKWRSEKAFGHNIMPCIEAAYIGNLPTTAFKRAFIVNQNDILPLSTNSAGSAFDDNISETAAQWRAQEKREAEERRARHARGEYTLAEIVHQAERLRDTRNRKNTGDHCREREV